VTERRTVYSTERPVCRQCGWPESDCRCSATLGSGREAVPKIVAKLRLEKRASGKSVTVVDNLPDNLEWLGGLAKEWKKACGTGGAVATGSIELQGDQRERLKELMTKRGWTVKG
jgi:translation initiation factor 1